MARSLHSFRYGAANLRLDSRLALGCCRPEDDHRWANDSTFPSNALHDDLNSLARHEGCTRLLENQASLAWLFGILQAPKRRLENRR